MHSTHLRFQLLLLPNSLGSVLGLNTLLCAHNSRKWKMKVITLVISAADKHSSHEKCTRLLFHFNNNNALLTNRNPINFCDFVLYSNCLKIHFLFRTFFLQFFCCILSFGGILIHCWFYGNRFLPHCDIRASAYNASPFE